MEGRYNQEILFLTLKKFESNLNNKENKLQYDKCQRLSGNYTINCRQSSKVSGIPSIVSEVY